MCLSIHPHLHPTVTASKRLLKASLLKTSILTGAALIALSMEQAYATQQVAPTDIQLAQAAQKAELEISQGPLQSALDQLARQTNQQIIHQLDLSSYQVPALRGHFTSDEALERMLAGTGLALERLDSQTLTIRLTGDAAQISNEDELPAIVVSATRTEQDMTTVPTAVVVIHGDEIEEQARLNSHPGKLLEKYVPGFGVSTGMMSGSGENFRGRGVQVLVDGVSRNTPLRNVTRTLSVIDLNQIERIEIIPGSTATYGNGATGGTVNFITKKAPEDGMEHSIDTSLRFFTADPDDSLAPKVTLSSSGRSGRINYTAVGSLELTQERFDGNGDQIASDAMIGQGNMDNARNIDFLGKVGFDLTDNQDIEVSYNGIRRVQDTDFFTDYTTDPVSVDSDNPYTGASVKEDSNHGSARYNYSNDTLGDVGVTFYHDDIEKVFAFTEISLANPLVLSTGSGSTTQDQQGQSVLTTKRFGARTTVETPFDSILEGLEATWGLDLSYEEVEQHFMTGQERIAPMTQLNYAPFVQLNAPVTDFLRFRGGVRYERYDLEIDNFRRPDIAYMINASTVVAVPGRNVIGGDFSYDEMLFNLGAVMDMGKDTEFYGGFSQGFSLPDIGSFTARAGINNPFATSDIDYSDLNIKTAPVDTFEVGFRTRQDDFRLEASMFLSKSKYGTNFDATTETLTQEKERIHGLEFSGEYYLSEETAVGTVLAYTEGKRDTDNDGSLDAYLPNNRIGAPFRSTLYMTNTLFDDLNLRSEMVYSSSRNKFDGSKNYKLGSTLTFNLAANYPLWDGTLSAGIENLFDREQKNPAATASRNVPIPGLGRTITVGYKRTF